MEISGNSDEADEFSCEFFGDNEFSDEDSEKQKNFSAILFSESDEVIFLPFSLFFHS